MAFLALSGVSFLRYAAALARNPLLHYCVGTSV